MPGPGGADDLIKFRNSGFPAKLAARVGSVADKPGRIARAAVSYECGNLQACDSLHGVDHLADGEAAPVPRLWADDGEPRSSA